MAQKHPVKSAAEGPARLGEGLTGPDAALDWQDHSAMEKEDTP